MAEFRAGLVEGFYGRQWSWQARVDAASFLSQQGFTEYIYCPKNDDALRKSWRTQHDERHQIELKRLAAHCASLDLKFSVGLSPLGFSGTNDLAQLLVRCEQLANTGFSSLYLLFDDMKGDDVQLATRQIEIINKVSAEFPHLKLGMCPTYYSDDPILDKLFGARPANYLEDLGQGIDKHISIFWTGEQVCSRSYSVEHLLDVSRRLSRKPLLWDNYPVNDGKKLCNFLFLQPPAVKSAQVLGCLEGCFSNPMNQAYLSHIPLHAIAATYSKGCPSDSEAGQLYKAAIEQLCPEISELLLRDKALFSESGLQQLGKQQREQLIREYSAMLTSDLLKSAARSVKPSSGQASNQTSRQITIQIINEIAAWLNNEYQFDPACLT